MNLFKYRQCCHYSCGFTGVGSFASLS